MTHSRVEWDEVARVYRCQNCEATFETVTDFERHSRETVGQESVRMTW